MDETKAAEAPRDQFAPPTPEEESELAKELHRLRAEASELHAAQRGSAAELLDQAASLEQQLQQLIGETIGDGKPLTRAEAYNYLALLQVLISATKRHVTGAQHLRNVVHAVDERLLLRALQSPLTAADVARLLGLELSVKPLKLP